MTPREYTMTSPLAVLTGDIIASRRLPAERLSAVLDATLALLGSRFGARTERYRGDGFQIALPEPRYAVTAAVLLRAELIRHSTRTQRWDARLAIAIGPGEGWQPTQRIAEASAPPFVASGEALDRLSGERHLVLRLPDAETGCLDLLVHYLDEMIDGWTPPAAEAVAALLCHAESQQVLADRLGISQPAVHKRLRTARWPLLQETLAYLEQRFSHYLREENPAP